MNVGCVAHSVCTLSHIEKADPHSIDIYQG